MRTIRTLLRWLGLALLALILAGWLPALLGAYGLHAKRYAGAFLSNPLNPAYDWYEPLETVSGRFVAPLPVAAPGESPFGPGVLDGAAEYARSHASDALLVLHRGRVVFQQYWNGRGPDSLFGAHSMTKTLNAILVGHAIADGRIRSVDDPVFYYLAEWDDELHRPITIRHLLYMASGLQESYDFLPWSQRMRRVMGTDIVAANLATEVAGPPGVKFAHINPPPQLVGIIIERATGRRFAEYLAEKLWQPIGARDAQLFVDRPGGTAHTDCCMWTAIEDWARVGEVLRTGGRWNGAQVIPAEWVEAMLGASPAYLNYGMFVWLGSTWEEMRYYDPDVKAFGNRHSERFAATDVFWLDGLHGQRVWIVPSKELVIVRTGASHPDWDDARIPNLLIRGMES
jgi:CubicO group peptidase (beta-lactamase class C family)